MEELLSALNDLVEQGVVTEYAIGGAVGASYYIEALQTEDVDAFVCLPQSTNGLLSLQSIYDALVRSGGKIDGAYVQFGAWPLQILPDLNDLIREAIRNARTVTFGATITRVFQAEYLFAIALQTGRAKDYQRAALLLESGAVDVGGVRSLLGVYGLEERLAKVPASAARNDD